MSTITTRSGKGSPLTNNEVDANFTNLNTDKIEVSNTPAEGDILIYRSSVWQVSAQATSSTGVDSFNSRTGGSYFNKSRCNRGGTRSCCNGIGVRGIVWL